MFAHDLLGKPVPTFRIMRRAQKGSPANGPGDSLLVAAQYIQKMLKNNGLFGIW
jgi:hypothetical protein